MDWIKCIDRMPQDGEYVIVATEVTAWVETHFVECCHLSGEKMWFSANEEAEPRPLSAFTHWMPMPEPPAT